MANTAVSDLFPESSNVRLDDSGIRISRSERRSSIASPSLGGPALMVAGDILAILLAAVAPLALAAFGNKIAPKAPLFLTPGNLLVIPAFVLAFVLVAQGYGVYRVDPARRSGKEVVLVVQSLLTAALLVFGTLYLARVQAISLALTMLFLVCALLSVCTGRLIARSRRFGYDTPGTHSRNVLIVGTGPVSRAVGEHLTSHRRLGYHVHGFVSLSPGAVHEAEAVPIDKVRRVAQCRFIDEIIIAEECTPDQTARLMREARDLGLTVRTVSWLHGDLGGKSELDYLGIFPVRSLHIRRIRRFSVVVKRVIDIVVSLLMLLAIAPLMCAVALAIVIDSPGPVFYLSERIGKRGRAFPCFKFRSMVQNADRLRAELSQRNERDGVLFKLRDDPRVTRVGAFLRKYSLDELPQLLNVLRGEMSIVGPRPPIPSEVEQYDPEHLRRLEVRPGLTGLWQVHARHDASFARYIALDTTYVEKWSLWLDFKIMLRTAEVVVRGTGC